MCIILHVLYVNASQQNMVQTFTLRTVFLVASMKVTDPNGLLDGDVLYVHAEPGYNNIAEMTNQMMSMVSHLTSSFYNSVLGHSYENSSSVRD
jgi:hypothetical protein